MVAIISHHTIDGAEVCWVEAGAFLMGSRYEAPIHEVELDGYWIYRKSVMNWQYLLFCQGTGAPRPPDPIPGYLVSYPDYPVVNVSWQDAQAYARWARGCLPSEAEWEKAARGGLVSKTYPWGDEEPDQGEWANFKHYKGSLADQRLNFDGRGRGPLPCGSFPANGLGLFDMAGNVWNWVQDYYDPDYYDVSPAKNPPGPQQGTTLVRRGGDWARSALSMRCACRSSMPPESIDQRMGFRLVMEPGWDGGFGGLR